jgi:putative ABC transport system permease protein
MQNYSALTTRYLKKHKGRTILTLIGIIIAIAMFTCIGSIYYSGINNEIENVKESTGNYEVLFSDISKDKVKVLSSNAEIKSGGTIKEDGEFKIDSNLLTESLKNVQIKSYDSAAIDNIFRIKMIEGRLPQNDKEIIVSKKFYAILKDKKIGGILKGELTNKQGAVSQSQYTIVGSFESEQVLDTAISYFDVNNSSDSNNYVYFANLKQSKGKVETAQKIADANNVKFDTNKRLLYLLGEGPDKEKNNDLEKVFGLIAGFVAICTVVVIYNAFNISVMERIKHFGILRSIGATKSQIRILVFKEAAIMSIIAVPIGIIAGFAGIMITFNVFMDKFLGTFEIGFYPQVIAVAGLLGITTIFVSAFFPARTASKVSPIDAIRGTMVVKGDRVKRRSGLWAKLIFRFEGQVAYKNIKRSRKRFYITCISLMISLVMFVFFSNFMDIYIQSNRIIAQSFKVEGAFRQKQEDMPLSKELANRVSGFEGVKEVFKVNYNEIPYSIDKNKVSDNFVESVERSKSTQQYKDKYIIYRTQIAGYDENTLKLLNKENKLGIDYKDFNENNGIIIYQKASGAGADKKTFYGSFTKYKVGDEISLPVINKKYVTGKNTEDLKKLIDTGKTITFKVAAVIDYDVINSSYINNGYGMIMSSQNYEKLTGISGLGFIAMNFDSLEASNRLYEKFNIIADENQVNYIDVYSYKEQSDKMQNQLMILVYGFIGLIILISTVNIINTVTINLLVKKREYATFKAIGMTKGQFKKLVLLEGALFGIIASIIGLPLSYLLTYFGILANNPLGAIGYSNALWPYICGGAGMIMITLLAALFPLRKLNDMNIVEALRIEE